MEQLTALATTAPNCSYDDIKVDGITYRRTCEIKQKVDAGKYSNDQEPVGIYDFDYKGLAYIKVTVTPTRTHLQRGVKPAVTTFWRVCEP